ncbi:hypothetical protein MKC91_06960 [[Clostridium] innocuum]|nr:hypothetical protein [[Clostridium] innocuum]MCR0411701.1 hypothetical protein [[Clostridium] innocuum]MCR0533126.1 hypothetical protein [[Clostridium] innocuum]MCR0538131.1 hypothetical protein [[Clostridium] innocuum]MDU1118284.1 hypothetical protein [Erysipelotrichaceae bacterium]
MTKLDITKTGRWIHRNARGLELAKWRFYFEGGDAESVIDELQYYQNTDGGFGHALEADCWNPASAPSQMFYAIHILHELAYQDTTHPVIQNMLRYLESGKDMVDGFWVSILPSNNQYPHAPWWTKTDRKTFDVYMPNADICWFILKFAQKDSPLYDRAVSMVQRMLNLFLSQNEVEPHSLESMMFLLRELQKTDSSCGQLEDAATAHGIQLMRGLIEVNPDTWTAYCITPSFFIHDRLHPLYPEYRELLKLEVQRLMETRDADGCWDINWVWQEYESAYRLSANWWKSSVTMQKLMLYETFAEETSNAVC